MRESVLMHLWKVQTRRSEQMRAYILALICVGC